MQWVVVPQGLRTRTTHVTHWPFYQHTQHYQWPGILIVMLMLVGYPTAADPGDTRRLAILVAAPWAGETAMHNDLVATHTAIPAPSLGTSSSHVPNMICEGVDQPF